MIYSRSAILVSSSVYLIENLYFHEWVQLAERLCGYFVMHVICKRLSCVIPN